ncbi:MAG: hypothetical protein ACKOZU_09365 [Planctomycetaceae bacterium]
MSPQAAVLGTGEVERDHVGRPGNAEPLLVEPGHPPVADEQDRDLGPPDALPLERPPGDAAQPGRADPHGTLPVDHLDLDVAGGTHHAVRWSGYFTRPW